MHAYVYMYTNACMNMHVYICMYVYACMYLHVYIYMYIHKYASKYSRAQLMHGY